MILHILKSFYENALKIFVQQFLDQEKIKTYFLIHLK